MARLDLSRFVGEQTELAYAQVLGGTVNGGLRDGGKDVIVPGIGGIQVKSSPGEAMKSLKASLQFRRFVPLCVGEPGTKEQVIESIKKFGAWFGLDIPNRAQLLAGVAQVRTMLM